MQFPLLLLLLQCRKCALLLLKENKKDLLQKESLYIITISTFESFINETEKIVKKATE